MRREMAVHRGRRGAAAATAMAAMQLLVVLALTHSSLAAGAPAALEVHMCRGGVPCRDGCAPSCTADGGCEGSRCTPFANACGSQFCAMAEFCAADGMCRPETCENRLAQCPGAVGQRLTPVGCPRGSKFTECFATTSKSFTCKRGNELLAWSCGKAKGLSIENPDALKQQQQQRQSKGSGLPAPAPSQAPPPAHVTGHRQLLQMSRSGIPQGGARNYVGMGMAQNMQKLRGGGGGGGMGGGGGGGMGAALGSALMGSLASRLTGLSSTGLAAAGIGPAGNGFNLFNGIGSSGEGGVHLENGSPGKYGDGVLSDPAVVSQLLGYQVSPDGRGGWDAPVQNSVGGTSVLQGGMGGGGSYNPYYNTYGPGFTAPTTQKQPSFNGGDGWPYTSNQLGGIALVNIDRNYWPDAPANVTYPCPDGFGDGMQIGPGIPCGVALTAIPANMLPTLNCGGATGQAPAFGGIPCAPVVVPKAPISGGNSGPIITPAPSGALAPPAGGAIITPAPTVVITPAPGAAAPTPIAAPGGVAGTPVPGAGIAGTPVPGAGAAPTPVVTPPPVPGPALVPVPAPTPAQPQSTNPNWVWVDNAWVWTGSADESGSAVEEQGMYGSRGSSSGGSSSKAHYTGVTSPLGAMLAPPPAPLNARAQAPAPPPAPLNARPQAPAPAQVPLPPAPAPSPVPAPWTGARPSAAPASPNASKCPPGTVYVASVHKCAVCPTGTHSDPQAGICRSCPPGYAAAKPGASACEPCDPGTYAGVKRSKVCSPCAPGTYSGPAAAACILAPPPRATVSAAAAPRYARAPAPAPVPRRADGSDIFGDILSRRRRLQE